MIHEPGGGIRGFRSEWSGALLIDRPTASDREIGRDTAIGKELHANPGCQKEGRRVSRESLVGRTDFTKRVGKQVNLAVKRGCFVAQSDIHSSPATRLLSQDQGELRRRYVDAKQSAQREADFVFGGNLLRSCDPDSNQTQDQVSVSFMLP